MTKITPLGSFMHVKVEKIDEISGIVLPDKHQQDEEVVEVLAVGPDVEHIKAGDRVIPIPESGIWVPVHNDKQVFIRESNIMAIIKEG